MDDKKIAVFKVNVSGEHGTFICRNIAEVKDFMDWFIDDEYLENTTDDGDFDWRFDIETVMMSEAAVNALVPFER